MSELKELPPEFMEKIVSEILELSPGLHPITAIIMAGDVESRDRADQMVKDGADPYKAAQMVGSFARFDWIVERFYAGELHPVRFLKKICELWRGSDPDDTNMVFLQVWKGAFSQNGKKYLRDGIALPRNKTITVYRGQLPNDTKMGIAWSTNRLVALKFALGAGVRVPVDNGVILSGKVKRSDILAYITGRNEFEVIVDPQKVMELGREDV